VTETCPSNPKAQQNRREEEKLYSSPPRPPNPVPSHPTPHRVRTQAKRKPNPVEEKPRNFKEKERKVYARNARQLSEIDYLGSELMLHGIISSENRFLPEARIADYLAGV